MAGGDLACGVALFGRAEGILADVGAPPEKGLHRDCYDRALAVARVGLPVAAFDAAWADGWRCRTQPLACEGWATEG